MVANVETSIWQRVVEPSWDELGAEAANAILQLKFRPADMDRMNRLGELAGDGSLSPLEQSELDAYLRIGRMVSVLQSKARLALKNPKGR